MPNYVFKYKCRFCGNTFEDMRTGSEKLAFKNLIDISCGNHADSCYLYNVHFTKDHYGFADLIGCKIEGET
jgi:hypothetical protein